MRRLGEGIEDHGKYILHYKGETPGLYGVGFLIKKKLPEKIEEIRGISERIAILNISLPSNGAKEEKWSIIQAYAPTESVKKEDLIKTEKFYQDLQTVIQCSYKNIIIMGDFNGQIGECKLGEEYIIGKYGIGSRSRNGQRIVNLASENKLCILNSFYKKKKTKKWTWISPNGCYKNEIDFIMSNNRKAFKNVSVVNNLNFNTDHKMIRATVNGTGIKKSRKHHGKGTNLVCTGHSDSLLKNLKEAIYISNEGNISTQKKYDKLIKQLVVKTRKTNADSRKDISTKTQQLLNERKELLQAKEKNRLKISYISKKINENIRRDKKERRHRTLRTYIEKTGGIKKALKELDYKKDWMLNMQNKDQKNTFKRPEILKIATDFYRNLYSTKDIEKKEKENYKLTESEEIPVIMKEETMKAIATQKADKAPGLDQITNELLKTTMPVISPKLTEIFNEILINENIPSDWTKSTIILLYKKGDKNDIRNYRPISLMSNVYKVFSKIILSRISKTLEENQPKEQAGFRSNFSTIDHIHVVRQVMQKYKEYKKVYFLGFVDFNKAFDCLEHEYIWEALQKQGVQEKYIRIFKKIYSNCTAQIKLDRLGEEFPIQRGVRQGDPISPKLFSAVLEMIFRNLDWSQFGLNINGESLTHLRFADDLVLFSESSSNLEQMLQQLSNESAKAGLSMNTAKTKMMSNFGQPVTIKVNDEQIENVSEYIYLGQLISTNNTMLNEIDRRIANTWKRYWSLSEIMKNDEMPIKEKRKIYNTCILPCLTYGCQTWALTKQLLEKIKVCQNGIERSTIGVKRRDKVRLQKIKKVTKFNNAEKVFKKLKWKWTGHILREKTEKWTRLITEWYPRNEKRHKGRQNKRWEDDIKLVAGPQWTRLAKDREKWKSLEEAFVEGQAVQEVDEY